MFIKTHPTPYSDESSPYHPILSLQFKWVPCYHGRERPQVADGDDIEIWGATTNIMNKQSRAADKWWSSRLWAGVAANIVFTIKL
jgi:hypothetical protein